MEQRNSAGKSLIKRFNDHWFLLTLLLLGVRIVSSPKFASLLPVSLLPLQNGVYKVYFAMSFNQWVYFSVGIIAYQLYNRIQVPTWNLMALGLLVILEFFFLKNVMLMVLLAGIIALFGLLIVNPRWLRFLENKYVLLIGLASYPLYLIHQNVGVILINVLAPAFETFNMVIATPVLVILIMIVCSSMVFIYWERPLMKQLRYRFQTFKAF